MMIPPLLLRLTAPPNLQLHLELYKFFMFFFLLSSLLSVSGSFPFNPERVPPFVLNRYLIYQAAVIVVFQNNVMLKIQEKHFQGRRRIS
jgi:hypothetical protein